MQSHLFTFSCISLALGDILARILLFEISEILLPIFSSRIFMVSQLIFKTFIPFEFILVYGVSWCSSLIFFFHIPFQFFPQHLLKGYFYSIVYSCSLCQISVDHRDTGLFLGSLFCSIGLCVCSYASTRLFWLQWPCSILSQISENFSHLDSF